MEFRSQLKRSLPRDATAPKAARTMLGLMRGAIHPDVMDDARLLVTELLTNNCRHSGTAQRAIVVDLSAGPDGLRAAVSDGGSGFSVPFFPSSAPSEDEHGLLLVEGLADRWGVDIDNQTTVWFEIDSPRAEEAGSSSQLKRDTPAGRSGGRAGSG